MQVHPDYTLVTLAADGVSFDVRVPRKRPSDQKPDKGTPVVEDDWRDEDKRWQTLQEDREPAQMLWKLLEEPLALEPLEIQQLTAMLDEVYEHSDANHSAAAIDLVLETMDDLLTEGEFLQCTWLLQNAEVHKLDSTAMLGFLSITLPVKQHLEGREQYAERVREELSKKRPPNEVERLLARWG